MQKDFDGWNTKKKQINSEKKSVLFVEREIWWGSIGINIGDEEAGKNDLFERPVLIVKKFNNKVAWVVPMTTKTKDNEYYYTINHDGIDFALMLSQLKLLSIKRLNRRIRKIGWSQFNDIRANLKHLI